MVAGKVRAAMGLSPKPATSSARVKPKPPDVAELVRAVEELRERESRLKTQLLEHKLLRESVAVLPILEREIAAKDEAIRTRDERVETLERELEREREKNDAFATEIGELNRLVEEFRSRELKRNKEDAEKEEISLSASQRFSSLAIKSLHLKRFKEPEINHENKKIVPVETEENVEAEAEAETCSSSSSETPTIFPSRTPRVAKPPPKPSSATSSSLPATSSRSVPPPPPPPARLTKAAPGAMPPPPPPPLPPAKGKKGSLAKVRRAPEVVEFYHSLMRRESRRESGGSGGGEGPAAGNPRDMIGEIENRSSHLLAIKTDVETQGDFIRSLITEVENASFTDIKDVVPFVKWLDDELSYLVDERAVLKHFEWPEQKADALREAAFGYCDLKKLESEATTFRDDPRQPCSPALKKMQALFEKLERGVYNLSRMRESASKRYNAFHIPTDWLLESGFASQIKLASVKLAMKYMRRVSAELEVVAGSTEEEELMVQGVRFAFRVHQFAGGFDVETMKAFQELREKATSCYAQCQTQQQQKYVCRSAAC